MVLDAAGFILETSCMLLKTLLTFNYSSILQYSELASVFEL